VTAITEDREGDIWVSTDGGGIDRLRPRLFRLYDKKSGLPEDASNAASVDQWGDVWLANRGGGVVRVRGGAVSVLQPHDGPLKLRAYSVCPDDEGYLWVSEDRLYRFPSANPDQVQVLSNGLAGNFTGIHVLFKSREGDIWIGADPHLLACFRGGRPENYVLQEKFPGQRPRSLAEDPSGRIWIGTEDRQLIQMADGKFTSFTRKDGLPDAPIRSLYADKDGAIWIGTVGGGMVLRRNGKFTLIAAADGLPDDNIAEVMEDDAGRMWCGSRSGIFQSAKRDLLDFADGKTGRVQGITLGKNEGITALSCYGTSQPMACKTPDGQLWFVTRQGVLALDSRAIKPNLFPPPIFIDEILANDRPLKITEPLEVPPRCDKIEFRFSALSFVAPGKVRLRYKLDGVDAGWVEIINQRSAVYSALPPGRYGLHVTACNNDGLWNETGTYLWFRVRPAWWQSWWFQSSLLILCITAAALGIRYWSQRSLKRQLEILERQQALEKERTRIARDLHDDLGATVTQVGLMLEELREASLSAEGVKHQSAAISGRVLNLARDLDAVVWSVNPRNDSLAELFAYLSQSFLECFQRTSIRPRLEVMEVVPDSSLAPEVRHHLFLIVKEAINNVIKHSQATQVTLSLGVVENALDIRMADNGQGFSTGAISQSKRHGLANMRARVQQLAGKLEISSHAGQGVSIHISIPSWQAMRVEQHHTE
jgi:signal transduction histidine kinase/streptogramin lyase